jgi:transcription antitermination protein NusB
MTDYLGFDPDGDEVINREEIPHEEAATDRSVARRVALQALYELDTAKHPVGDVLNHHLAHQKINKVRTYVTRLVQGISARATNFDGILQAYAPEWPISQVATIDRNILRIALWELAIEENIPVGVAIDEAIELSKLFGAENSSRFINGVLGTIADNIDAIRETLSPTPE